MYATLDSYTTFKKERFSELSPLMTFIIPSIGRPTLVNTLESLKRMTNPNWKALVVFDGIEPTLVSDDPRIKLMTMEKIGVHNHAGRVRNEGIRHAKTDWVGFVDDDDTLQPTYMTRFYDHLSKSSPDVILFRMKNSDGRILPLEYQTDFYMNDVGISFCTKRSLFVNEKFWFEPSPTEDFDLLDRLRSRHKYILMSPHVEYIVR